MAQWTVHAAYDADSQRWYTADSDVPGLVTSGRTLEELRERAALIIPELLALNSADLEPGAADGPHSLRIVAFHESVMSVAA